MEFYKAFPVAIIDEDIEGKTRRRTRHARTRGGDREGGLPRRRRASATRTRGGSCTSSTRESCWLVSVDGAEDKATRWEILEEVLVREARQERPAADLPVRRRDHRRDGAGERAAPRQRLHAAVRGFAGVHGARDRARGAALPRSPAAADVQGADGLHAARQLFLAHARPRRRRRVPQEPGRPALLRVLRREHPALRHLGLGRQRSARCSTTPGPIAEGERNAARIFGADETLFVVGGTSTANKIVWHGMVGRGDLVLCDRNCHKSILHSLIMTGATPIYLVAVAQRPRHHRADLARTSSRPQSIAPEDRREPVRRARRAARSA